MASPRPCRHLSASPALRRPPLHGEHVARRSPDRTLGTAELRDGRSATSCRFPPRRRRMRGDDRPHRREPPRAPASATREDLRPRQRSAGHRRAANVAASETPSLSPGTDWTRSAVGSPLRSATMTTRATVAAFRAAWAVSRRIAVTSRACAATSGEAAASRLLAFGSALTGMITVHCTLASVDYTPRNASRFRGDPAHHPLSLDRCLLAQTRVTSTLTPIVEWLASLRMTPLSGGTSS